jgi:hypothetical protein
MKYTALVLAARRPDEQNPLSLAEGVTHKCLIDMGGMPMIARVIRTIALCPEIGTILISTDDSSSLSGISPLDDLVSRGRLKFVRAGDNLFQSVKQALPRGTEYPVLVTTADNALMTEEMIARFLSDFGVSTADVGVAITRAETVWAKYPDGQRRPHRFADGPICNCNIFGLRNASAVTAAKAFEGGGQFGKSKLRVLRAFGFVNLLLYLSKQLTLGATFKRISKSFGVTVEALGLPFAEAPIDVDNERTARIARQIIAERKRAAAEARSVELA